MNHLAAATNNHQTEVIMNQMTPFGNPEKTMSSIELREIINAARAEHKESQVENSHFLKRIEDELEGELGGTKTFRPAQGGTPMRYYELTRDQCTLVGMRESKGVRRNVLAKLKELELKSQLSAIPQTKAELLRYAADLEEEKQAALEQLEAAKPAVEFVGRYVEAAGTMTFREVAKVLGLKQHELRQLEVEHKIMYQINGRWTPYQHQIDAGRFAVKTGSADNGHAFTQARYTPKGVEYMAKLAGLEVAA